MRAYFHTYGLPVLTTNCSNNYGPYQFPEKLIPLMIDRTRAARACALPVYGNGSNVRDWLYVEDHCEAISRVLEAMADRAKPTTSAANSERSNLDVVTEPSAPSSTNWRLIHPIGPTPSSSRSSPTAPVTTNAMLSTPAR